jgi:GTP cyclohydrolase II
MQNSKEHKLFTAALDRQIIFSQPIEVQYKIRSLASKIWITKVFEPKDTWKLYYIVSKKRDLSFVHGNKILLRVDSGCVSGQIYDDDSCDCADQFYDFIEKHVVNNDGIIIHIPFHDGRGFGFAPKAETEIYKQGGKGKINSTEPMDTISAAKLLYNADDNNYDIRDYRGVIQILMALGCGNVKLYTDSRKKVDSLLSDGIEVERIPTETNKLTCIQHIKAKKSNLLFYNDFFNDSI